MAKKKKRVLPSSDYWLRALPRILKRGFVKPGELELASDFKSCAVAEARASVQPRLVVSALGRGTPDDEVLADLGYKFFDLLSDGELAEAAETYAEIIGRGQALALKQKFFKV
jgi:hypothetical protein